MAQTTRMELWSSIGSVTNLTSNSSTQLYPLGAEIVIWDETYQAVKKFIYVRAHGTLTINNVYVVAWNTTAGREVSTAAAATTTTATALPCVATYVITSGYYGWVQTQGHCEVVPEAGGWTAGNALKMANAVGTLTDEAAAVESAYTAAYAVDTGGTGGVAVTAYLIGNGKHCII
jgi:hypothetical protein